MQSSKAKIGILTFQKASSFGAVLQCYALYRTIKKLYPDADVGVVDLIPGFIAKKKDEKWEEYRKFYDFTNKHVNLLTYEKSTLPECMTALRDPSCPITDLVVGSDQVWNPKIVKDNIKDYFMGNVADDVRRYSYAASFGTETLETDDETGKIISDALAGYKKISVRETSAIDICRRYGRDDAVHVLDPTLLADPEIYSELIKPDNVPYDTISGFFLAHAPSQAQVLKKIAGNCKTKAVFAGIKAPFWSFTKSVEFKEVYDFVSLIHNSRGIVTDSFHGVCFSIIFRKPFVVLPSPRKERFVRIADLLKMLQLEDRVCSSRKPEDAACKMQKNIDWQQVYTILEQKRNESMKFLTAVGHEI